MVEISLLFKSRLAVWLFETALRRRNTLQLARVISTLKNRSGVHVPHLICFDTNPDLVVKVRAQLAKLNKRSKSSKLMGGQDEESSAHHPSILELAKTSTIDLASPRGDQLRDGIDSRIAAGW